MIRSDRSMFFHASDLGRGLAPFAWATCSRHPRWKKLRRTWTGRLREAFVRRLRLLLPWRGSRCCLSARVQPHSDLPGSTKPRRRSNRPTSPSLATSRPFGHPSRGAPWEPTADFAIPGYSTSAVRPTMEVGRSTEKVSEIALQPAEAGFSQDAEILKIITELRDVFENNFDRTWFSLILDGIPIDLRTVRNIRELVSLTSLYPGEEWQILRGIQELEAFYVTVKRFLLPGAQGEAGHLLAAAAEQGQGPPPVHPSKVRCIHVSLQPRTPAPAHHEAEIPSPAVLSVSVLTVVHCR